MKTLLTLSAGSLAGLAVLAAALLALAGCAPAAPNAVESTVCDRGSACDLFGCGPDCDSFVGDAAPPSTTVKVCRGALPSTSLIGNADAGGCITYDVGAVDRSAPDLLNSNDDDTFRHVYWLSGDPACVGTGKPLTSGRDCSRDSPDGQCAYIAEGYALYAVTGGSCSEAGVGLCSGPFCR